MVRTVEAPVGPVHLRRANPADARGIATIHVETWKQAYRGLVPQEMLERVSVEVREGFWREAVADVAADRRPWIAESEGRAVGFISGGISRDDDASSTTGEVYAQYVSPGYWGMGIGRHLLDHLCRDLRQHGFHVATLWVLATNTKARAFYEGRGWTLDGATKVEEVSGSSLVEVRYRKDL